MIRRGGKGILEREIVKKDKDRKVEKGIGEGLVSGWEERQVRGVK